MCLPGSVALNSLRRGDGIDLLFIKGIEFIFASYLNLNQGIYIEIACWPWDVST
jgi:hypothetical protein